VLEVADLRFAYPNCREVIDGVSLSVEKGGRLAIVGENGSGKTTLARLMCGLLQPSSGKVTVDGLDTRDARTIHEVRRRVGIVFQDPEDQIVETTVEREIGFGPRNLGLGPGQVDERVEEAMSLFGIGHLRGRSCHLLSAGEKQTLAVASVFAMKPEYVILDESTSLLDSASRKQAIGAVERLLAETGAGLVFISMRIEDVWMCRDAMFLKEGRIDFRGGRAGLLAHLAAGLPLAGTALFVAEREKALPGFARALEGHTSLDADSLAAALLAWSGSGRRGVKEAGGGEGRSREPDSDGRCGEGRREEGGACLS
jgi:energy-coupling factor transport system ATP-binding protein